MDEDQPLEVVGPVGTVTAYTWAMRTCSASWGGWAWFADGQDEAQALEHLRQRMEALDPFFGGPDYGARYGAPYNPEDLGSPAELDPRIPETTQRRIAAYLEAIDEKWRRESSA